MRLPAPRLALVQAVFLCRLADRLLQDGKAITVERSPASARIFARLMMTFC
jgi:hypothetical protein